MIQIPLTNQPNQTLQTTLPTSTGNLLLSFGVSWNGIAEYWQLTIFQDGAELITNAPMLPALGPYVDIIGQWAHLNLGHFFVVPISPTAPDTPGLTDWGINFALWWSE